MYCSLQDFGGYSINLYLKKKIIKSELLVTKIYQNNPQALKAACFSELASKALICICFVELAFKGIK